MEIRRANKVKYYLTVDPATDKDYSVSLCSKCWVEGKYGFIMAKPNGKGYCHRCGAEWKLKELEK